MTSFGVSPRRHSVASSDNSDLALFLFVLVLWVVCGLWSGQLSQARGGTWLGAFLLGLFLGPIGLWITWHGARQTENLAMYRECPHCKEQMRSDALVCPHCRLRSVPRD